MSGFSSDLSLVRKLSGLAHYV